MAVGGRYMLWVIPKCRRFGPDDNFVDKSVNDVNIRVRQAALLATRTSQSNLPCPMLRRNFCCPIHSSNRPSECWLDQAERAAKRPRMNEPAESVMRATEDHARDTRRRSPVSC